ncbi:sequestosome-1 [Leptopilina heterotoma]|uniref:sequestosome-1 n=1 Tax=Leptopilina heterotoma TaxID=63436 RepID=UPI001CA80F27|nr:sequestosome-1 [Leptopilina heterotoma]
MAGTIVNFKVYLTKENAAMAKTEVRRFGIDSDIVSDFQYLREKLQTIFPNIRGKRFSVSWKDCDGDNIVISSDEELQIALLETHGAMVRKFYLTLYSEYEQQGTQATAPEEGVRHDGVTCDGCDKSVYGFRYKCIQCPDYDLCKECEGQSLHPEHCMLRLPIPMPYSKNRYIRHFGRRMNKYNGNSTDNTKECPKSCKFESRSRHCGNNFPWTDLLGAFVYDHNNSSPNTTAKECAQEKSTDQTQTQTQKQQQQQESSSSQFRRISETNIEFLKNIGEQIAQNIGEHITQFLDPLGIDVNVPLKNNTKQQQENKTDGIDAKNMPSTSSSADESPSKEASIEENQSEMEDRQTVKEPATSKANEPIASIAEIKKTIENLTLEKNTPEPEGWTLLNENDSPPTTTNSSPSSSRAPSVSEVPPAESSQPSASPVTSKDSSTSPDKPLYPPLPKEGKVPFHSNPKIQRAIETMMEMGFSNEGGWLTHLLVTKEGDISKALDILAPIRR